MTTNPFTILIVAATESELSPLRDRLEEQMARYGHSAGVVFRYLSTGVGGVATAAALTEELLTHPCDAVLNIGLGGALSPALALGDVVLIESDDFGDLGAEDVDGSHLSLFDLGFADRDAAPFADGRLLSRHSPAPVNDPSEPPAHARELGFFHEVLQARFGESRRKAGTTVSQAHGSQPRIDRFLASSTADVESMEGAAVAWVAFRQNLPSVQLRGISNRVEPRNREAWRIADAMDNLTTTALELLLELREKIQAAPVSPPPPSQ